MTTSPNTIEANHLINMLLKFDHRESVRLAILGDPDGRVFELDFSHVHQTDAGKLLVCCKAEVIAGL